MKIHFRFFLSMIISEKYQYFLLLHEWIFSQSPIGLNRGWAKIYYAITTSDVE